MQEQVASLALGKRAFIVTGASSGWLSGALADVTAALDSKGVAYEKFDLFAKQTAGRNPMLSTGVPGDEQTMYEFYKSLY